MKNNIKVVTETIKLQLNYSFSRSTFKFTIIIQPIIYTFLVYFMLKNSSVSNISSYIMINSTFISLWSSIIYSSASDISRERWLGTLSVVLITPAKFIYILIGKIFANVLLALVPLIINFLLLFLLQERIAITSVPYFIITLFLSIISIMSLSLLLSYFFALSRSGTFLLNCFEFPFYLIMGLGTPVTHLPTFIQKVSTIFSPTYSIMALKMCTGDLNNIPNKNFSFFWYRIIFLTFSYILICLLFDNKMNNLIKREGNLDF